MIGKEPFRGQGPRYNNNTCTNDPQSPSVCGACMYEDLVEILEYMYLGTLGLPE
jgi:hypothetical protein